MPTHTHSRNAVPRRRWMYRLLAVGLGILLLVGAELIIRATGVAQHTPPTNPPGWGRGHRLAANGLEGPFLETGKDGLVRTVRQMVDQRFMHASEFSSAPEPGVQRVFCFGGSATYGVPVEREPERTWPGRLQAQLGARGVPSEVINLGGASFASDQVAALAEQVVAYGPSAFVVYSGNNEFFAYDIALVEANRNRTRVPLDPLHLYRLIRRVAWRWQDKPETVEQALREAHPDEIEAHQRDEVAGMLVASLEATGSEAWPAADGTGQYRRRDAHHAAVVQRFDHNLRSVERIATEHGIAFIVVDIPANLLAPPWLTLHRPDVGPLGRQRWRRSVDTGDAAIGNEQWEEAQRTLSAAIAIDPMAARAHYLRGLARRGTGDVTGANHDLRNALALDMDPGRPVPALSKTIRGLETSGDTVVVRLEQSFGAQGHPPFGEGLFHDTGHLTPSGYDKVARAVFTALIPELLRRSPTTPGSAPTGAPPAE